MKFQITAVPDLFFSLFLSFLHHDLAEYWSLAGFKVWTSGVRSDRSTNCATTTAHVSSLRSLMASLKNRKGKKMLISAAETLLLEMHPEQLELVTLRCAIYLLENYQIEQ